MSAGVHLYCIVPRGHEPRGVAGLEERPVRAIALDDFAVWASDHERRPEPSVERALRHNAVVEAALEERVTPLPLRFGQFLADAAAVDAAFRADAPAWQRRLRDVAGCVEFGLRVLGPEGDPQRARDVQRAPAGGGRAYLESVADRLARTRRRRERALEALPSLREAFGEIVLREHIDHSAEAAPLSVAHLVPRARTGDYRRALDAVRVRWPGHQFLPGGPWPPYSFCE